MTNVLLTTEMVIIIGITMIDNYKTIMMDTPERVIDNETIIMDTPERGIGNETITRGTPEKVIDNET